MGLSMIPGREPAKVRAGTATPLLGFLAGDRAGVIAGLWGAPHTGFLTLPAARRHAAAILLDRQIAGAGRLNHADIAHAAARAKDSEVAALLLANPQPGLMKAMGRMGEWLWNGNRSYDLFLQLFSEPEAAKVLRHMKEIRAGKLNLLGALPMAVRTAKVIDAVPHLAAAQDLAKAHALILRMKGEDERFALAARWGRAKDAAALFDMAAEDLRPVTFRGLTPTPVLPAPFEAVTDRKALERVALEFRNCLRDFVADLARGQMAVYIWRGEAPAAVALRADPAGWRLAEVETADNAGIADGPLREIVAAVTQAGVRTGVGVWPLAGRLHRHGCNACGPDHRKADEGWRDALELGDLWDG